MEHSELTNVAGRREREGVSSPTAKKRQAAVVLVAGGGCFVHGCLLGFTAASGTSLLKEGRENLQELSWIVSLLLLGSFLGTLCSPLLLDKFGRRFLLSFVCGLGLAGANALVLASFNTSTVVLCVGRLLGGLSMGVQSSTAVAYLGETALRDVRGAAGFAGTQLASAAGVAVTTWVGAVVQEQYWVLSLLAVAVAATASVCAWLLAPESPRWLLSKGREYSASKSLEWLRGRHDDDIDRELESLKKEISRETYFERRGLSAIAKEKGALTAALKSVLLMFLCAFSGAPVVLLYLGTILQHASWPQTDGVNDVAASVALCGASFLLSSPLSAAAVSLTRGRRRWRQALAAASALFAALLLAILGWCLRSTEEALSDVREELLAGADKEAVWGLHAPPAAVSSGWLPALSAALVLMVSNAGFGTLSWIAAAEMAPTNVAKSLSSVSACAFHLSAFVAAKTFPALMSTDAVNTSGGVFLSAAFCLVVAVALPLLTPEPRGESNGEGGGGGANGGTSLAEKNEKKIDAV